MGVGEEVLIIIIITIIIMVFFSLFLWESEL